MGVTTRRLFHLLLSHRSRSQNVCKIVVVFVFPCTSKVFPKTLEVILSIWEVFLSPPLPPSSPPPAKTGNILTNKTFKTWTNDFSRPSPWRPLPHRGLDPWQPARKGKQGQSRTKQGQSSEKAKKKHGKARQKQGKQGKQGTRK